jgi:hypothetical protein
MQDGVVVSQEDAEAALLAGPDRPLLARLDEFFLGLEAVLDGRDVLVVRDVEVVVEVAAGRARVEPVDPVRVYGLLRSSGRLGRDRLPAARAAGQLISDSPPS